MAIVAVPSLHVAAGGSVALRRWLDRGDLASAQTGQLQARVIEAVGLPPELQAGAAYRWWGQTGQRSDEWLAAADPVHMEARLDHLCVRHVGLAPAEELQALAEDLNTALQQDGYSFVRNEGALYLRSERPFETSIQPPATIDGLPPDEFMPAGPSGQAYLRLTNEIQMILHANRINTARQGRGLPALNSLWIWGGGVAPTAIEQPLPTLYASDPLVRGAWYSRQGRVVDWTGEAPGRDAFAPGVVILPSADAVPSELANCLEQARQALSGGIVNLVRILTSDGFELRLRRSDRWRFWRRGPVWERAK